VSAVMDDKLRAHLDELEAKIADVRADDHLDDAERAELRQLIERVREELGQGHDREGLADQLEESAVRFESDHPTLAAVIRSAVQTLTGYGI